MKQREAPAKRLYCLPLVRQGGVLTIPEEWTRAGIDLPPADEMREYLTRHHTLNAGTFQTSAGTFRSQIYVPKDTDDYHYTLVTADLVPPEHVAHEPDVEQEILDYLDNLRMRLASSEGMLPEQACSLWTEFIQPQFLLKESKRTATTSRSVRSWRSLANISKLLVAGPAGAGKTTLLRRLTLDLADIEEFSRTQCLPIYIQLRRWVSGESVERVAKRELAHMGAPRAASRFSELAAAGRVVLIFDGFDEIPVEWREGVASVIHTLTQKFDTCRYIISTRPAAVSAMFRDFERCELEPFTHMQIQELCWHKLDSHSKGWKSFWVRLAAERELMDVSSNPFALSLIVARFKRNEVSPHFVSEALRLVIEALSDEWDSTRGVRRSAASSLSPAQKLGILRRLASHLLAEDRAEFSTADFVSLTEQMVSAGHVASATLGILEDQTGLIRRTADDRWQFGHRAILEFLASVSLADKLEAPVEGKNASADERLHRIWRYACGQVSDAGPSVAHILRQTPYSGHSAILLSEAMSQDLLLQRSLVEGYSSYLLVVLEMMLTGASVNVESFSDSAANRTQICVLNIHFTRDISKSDTRAETVARLLTSSYAARDGSACLSLKTRLKGSEQTPVQKLASLFDSDGLIEAKVTHKIDEELLTLTITQPALDTP